MRIGAERGGVNKEEAKRAYKFAVQEGKHLAIHIKEVRKCASTHGYMS